MTDRGARIAAFVKTPGRSAIKTRLAAGIGPERAAEFYDLAVRATLALLEEARRARLAEPCWAVAESDAAAAWPTLPVVEQGDGELGDRLDRVYTTLREAGGAAMLIGADAPALSVKHVERAV